MASALLIGSAVAGLAGTALGVVGQIQQGNAAEAQAKFQARQLEQQAIQEAAAGQHSARERRRQSELLQSRALAAAGASGAGTLDPDVLRIISNLEVEGERAAQADLYQSRSQAEQAQSQAGATRYEGALARRASRVRASSTFLGGVSNAAMSYGNTLFQNQYRGDTTPGGYQMR